MDLSINDLIVKKDRPASALRNTVAQIAPGATAAVSSAAFNELLNSFRPAPARPEPASRSGNDPEPVHAERANRGDAPQRPREETEPARSRDASDDASDDAGPRDAEAAHAAPVPVAHTSSRPEPAAPATAARPAGSATPPAHADSAAAADGTAPANGTDAAKFQAAEAAASAHAANAARKSAQAAAGTAADAPADPAAAQQLASKQAIFRDLLGGKAGDAPAVDPAAQQAAGAMLNRASQPGANAKPAAPQAAADTPVPGTGHGPAADGAAKAPDLPRINIAATVEAEPAPLRAPATPGLLALQEVSGAATSTAPATGTAPSATGSNTGTTTGTTGTPTAPAAGPASADAAATAGAHAGIAAPPGEAAQPLRAQPAPGTGLQPLSGMAEAGPAKMAQASAANPAARPAAPVPVPVTDVAVHIARAAASGVDHISIKLKPAALGQIEVKLELTHDGRVAAVVTAERAETLDILARDAKSLERALADAGLKTDQGSLQFNLRSDGQHGNGAARDGGAPAASAAQPDEPRHGTPTAELALFAGYANARAASGGIDIRV